MRLTELYALTFAFTFLICIDGTKAAAIPVIIYADDSYAPYSYQENGVVKGLYTKILKTAFSRMLDYEVTLETVPWKRGLKLLETGAGFALYPPYFHYVTRPYIWPYSLPILEETVVVYCHRKIMEKHQRSQWPEDYFGLRIGINAGFKLGREPFWQAVNNEKIHLIEVRGNRKGLVMLAAERLDCYMNDKLSILTAIKALKDSGEYQEDSENSQLIEGTTITFEQGFLGYTNRDKGKFTYKDDFKKQLDEQIYEMRRSGELQQIIDNFNLEETPTGKL